MKKVFVLLFISLLSGVGAQAARKPERFIAVTSDYLPVVSTRKDLAARREITRKLLGHITAAKIPAIGFVNENKLYANDKPVAAELNLLSIAGRLIKERSLFCQTNLQRRSLF